MKLHRVICSRVVVDCHLSMCCSPECMLFVWVYSNWAIPSGYLIKASSPSSLIASLCWFCGFARFTSISLRRFPVPWLRCSRSTQVIAFTLITSPGPHGQITSRSFTWALQGRFSIHQIDWFCHLITVVIFWNHAREVHLLALITQQVFMCLIPRYYGSTLPVAISMKARKLHKWIAI